MRIPFDTSNKALLANYIRKLIAEDKLYKFYKTDDWLELREEVLKEQHYECQRCLNKGQLEDADMVHHEIEVKDRPDLALSKFYIDEDGNEQRNLNSLSNKCHNIDHDRFQGKTSNKQPLNEERW